MMQITVTIQTGPSMHSSLGSALHASLVMSALLPSWFLADLGEHRIVTPGVSQYAVQSRSSQRKGGKRSG
jgi:hypothetical protein